MRYKLTILNACSAAFMIGLIIYAMTNYSDLKNEDGFGIESSPYLVAFKNRDNS